MAGAPMWGGNRYSGVKFFRAACNSFGKSLIKNYFCIGSVTDAINMNGKIPAYLYEKGNTVKMIVFTAVFALLFINIFQPFGSRAWYPAISDFKYFTFSSLIILTGMLVVVVSRVILAVYSKKNDILYWLYGFWILCEVLAMAVFYSLFSKFVPKESADRDFMDIFRQSAVNTALVLLLPYAISWLYFSWKEKSLLLANMEQEKTADPHTRTLVAFPDEKGDLKISITLENLLYIEFQILIINISFILNQ